MRARALEAGIRAGLEEAVRTRVSTVTVDRDGRVQLTDSLAAAFAGVHGDVVGAWTFGNLSHENVTQDEVDWATDVLITAWEGSRRGR